MTKISETRTKRKGKAACDGRDRLQRFMKEALVSTWKQGGSVITDYESRTIPGLILRRSDHGQGYEGLPLRFRVTERWMLQCAGRYPLELGGDMRVDEAHRLVRQLRAGDGRACVSAYLTNTNFEDRYPEEDDARA